MGRLFGRARAIIGLQNKGAPFDPGRVETAFGAFAALLTRFASALPGLSNERS